MVKCTNQLKNQIVWQVSKIHHAIFCSTCFSTNYVPELIMSLTNEEAPIHPSD